MLTWGGPSAGVFKLIKLIVPFCAGERPVLRGARLGLTPSSMREDTQVGRGEMGGHFIPFAKKNLGFPLQTFNGDSSSLCRGLHDSGRQSLLRFC